MHAVIYKFILKEGKADNFLESWLELTKLIYKYEGCLGSRMHKVNDQEYIAYAQWPNKEIFANSGDNLPAEETNPVRKRMKDACVSIETLYEMDMATDYLQKNPYPE